MRMVFKLVVFSVGSILAEHFVPKCILGFHSEGLFYGSTVVLKHPHLPSFGTQVLLHGSCGHERGKVVVLNHFGRKGPLPKPVFVGKLPLLRRQASHLKMAPMFLGTMIYGRKSRFTKSVFSFSFASKFPAIRENLPYPLCMLELWLRCFLEVHGNLSCQQA